MFGNKSNYEYHIKSNTCKKETKKHKCGLCRKGFVNKSNLNKHKKICKKNINENVEPIIISDNNKLEDANNTKIQPIENYNDFHEIIKQLQMQIDELKNQIKDVTNVTNNINNTTNTTNTTNTANINQTINIIAFGQEDITKYNKSDIFKCLMAGYYYPVELTMYINFNEKYPENHSILLNNVRDSNIKYHNGNEMVTKKYDDFFDDIIDRGMSFYNDIKEKQDNLYNHLPKRTRTVIENLETMDINHQKYKEIKQNARNKIIDKRYITKKK